jgi:hypothetical protein
MLASNSRTCRLEGLVSTALRAYLTRLYLISTVP